MRILIHGGLVIDPSQGLEAVRDVLIDGDKISAITPPSGSNGPRDAGARVIDARDHWVLPGLIDMHVHLREPGREADETIATGTRAAAQGGVTTVLAMPNTEPVIDSAAMVGFLRERARADGAVNVLIAGAVTRGQQGADLAEMSKLAEAGAVAVTDDGRPIMDEHLLRRALEAAGRLGLPVLDHCEDIRLSAGGVMNAGSPCAARGLRGIPPEAETSMAERDIALAERAGGRLHLCHVSCAKTVEAVRRAKRRGVRVSAETAPHYFTLTEDDVADDDADFKMNPPLRSRVDRAAVLEGLADGSLDAVATDHAPHSPDKKALGLAGAPFGVIGLETLLPLTLALVERDILTRAALVERLCAAPARILGLKTKGSLRPGMDADLTVVDPAATFVVGRGSASKSRNSPFKDRRLKGRAAAVVVGGRVVLEGGRLA